MKCIHCLNSVSKVTMDHVFPKSWYTSDTPENMEKPKAPSCYECNNALGKIENQLFVQLAGCVDPKNAAASGIKARLLKDLGINQANLSGDEKRVRLAKAKKLLRSAQPYNPNVHKTFPGLGPHNDYPEKLQHVFPVPYQELLTVATKTIKGLEYVHEQRYIEPPLKVKVYHVDIETGDVTLLFQKFAERTTYGPGFEVKRAKSENVVLYKCIVWGTWIYYGSIDIIP